MKLHIELDPSHPAYAWLEKQADRIGARGHFGTHIDCYSSKPDTGEITLLAYVVDCRKGMPTLKEAELLPSLAGKALVLYTGNLYENDYGTDAYFNLTDTSLEMEVLTEILKHKPRLILIDSYGIGRHGQHHIERDVLCEQSGCFVAENIRIAPEEADKIHRLRVKFDLDYPATGKPCIVEAVE